MIRALATPYRWTRGDRRAHYRAQVSLRGRKFQGVQLRADRGSTERRRRQVWLQLTWNREWSEKGSPSRRREASQIRDLTIEQSGSRAAAIGQERAQGAPRAWTQRQDEEPELQQPELGNGAKCAQGGCSKLHGARITAGRAPPDQTTGSTRGFRLLFHGHLPVFSHTTSREPRRHRPALFLTPAFPAIDAAGGSQRLPGFHRRPGTGERCFEWLRRLGGSLAKTSAHAVLLARRLGQRWGRFHFRIPCLPFYAVYLLMLDACWRR